MITESNRNAKVFKLAIWINKFEKSFQQLVLLSDSLHKVSCKCLDIHSQGNQNTSSIKVISISFSWNLPSTV